ncbi:MAG: AraC family transcriptional regulator [Intrasporangium sp.]|uniref:helix-turn-helix domain-containing protein n=1 Tax=Intrasporangium sp. TaxID=1925024 RepID=UPI00264A0D7D|nr:AraC family transcriptional regulator [Intrasporangium sp.]MDN5796035.1 AraC family transcriptional regulator [Intrasporangium sp.]
MGDTSVEHVEHVPGPRLAPWVQSAVGYRLTGFPAGVHVGMPSGSLTLVIPLGQRLAVADGSAAPREYGAVLAGLSDAPSFIHHDGTQYGVQLALRPAAPRALLGVPASELAKRSYELADLVGVAAERLREQVDTAGSWQERFILVDRMLATLLAGAEGQPVASPEVSEAWRVIRRTGGAVPIRRVAAHVGWSMRRLQTRFHAEFGLAPKAAAVVTRFERSVPLVARGALSLSEIAVLCGWSDHAHMDRDWRALAGSAPTRWRNEDALVGT